MKVVFFCQSCGARFDVDGALAGKKGRCKKCGQMFTIPKPQELASMVALAAVPDAPALAAAAAPVARGKSAAPIDWLKNLTSSVGLAPITIEHARPVKQRFMADALADLGDSKPYSVAAPRVAVDGKWGTGGTPNQIQMHWRKELGVVQRLFRWLNETAYLVSVPFIMVVILGITFRSRPVALFGATVVILINAMRLVTGLANVVIIPFRDGPLKGILFLIPPITFVYMANHWNKMRKPVSRVIGPLVTVGLVVLAFTFIPWLSTGSKSGSVVDRLREEVTELKADVKEQVGKAKSLDLEQIEAKGRTTLEKLRQAGTGEGGPAPSATGPNPQAAVDGLLKDVNKRTSELIRQSQSPP